MRDALGRGNKNFEQHFQKIIFGLWYTIYTYLWSVFNMSLISPGTGGKSTQLYLCWRKLSLKHCAHGSGQVKYNPSDIALLSKLVQYLDKIGGLLQWLHKTVDKSEGGFTYVSSYYNKYTCWNGYPRGASLKLPSIYLTKQSWPIFNSSLLKWKPVHWIIHVEPSPFLQRHIIFATCG